MKNLSCLLLAGVLAPCTFGQSIVLGVSHYGTASSNAAAGDYRYTRGGSPRTGFYWYWRSYQDQYVQKSADIPLNGNSGVQMSVATFYPPAYFGSGYGSTSFSNSPTQAVYDVHLESNLVFQPMLKAHQSASVGANTSDSFTFTIDQSRLVSLSMLTSPNATVQLINVASNEAVFSGSGSMSFSDMIDPGTYTLVSRVFISGSKNMQTSVTTNVGVNKTSVTAELKVLSSGG